MDCLRPFDFGLLNVAGGPLSEWTNLVWPPQAGTKTVSRRTSRGIIAKFAVAPGASSASAGAFATRFHEDKPAH